MQTLYYNGIIHTFAAPAPAAALLVADGRVQAAGAREELEAAARADCRRVDLQGHTMLPSFIDAHSHITAYAQTFSAAHLSKSTSFAELQAQIRAFLRDNPTARGQFAVAFGYDHNLLREHAHPTRAVLDAACPDAPLIMSHASGHIGALNTAALHILGITRDTPDPPGGRIGRGPDGEPNGYLEETAFTQAGARVPQPGEQSRLHALEQAQAAYIRHGITTVQDGLTRETEWKLLRTFAEQGHMQVDTVCYLDMKTCGSLLDSALQQQTGRLRVGGYKIFLDGSPQGRTAWLTAPYESAERIEGNAAYCGYPTYDDETVYDFVRQCCERRVQLLAHCNGDAAAGQFIAACERAQHAGYAVAAIRPVMIHAQLVRRDQLARMRACGLTASFFIAHTWYWGDAHLENLGKTRAMEISPAASALREGVPFTFHQDTPVLPPDMLQTVWCAARRVTRSGAQLDPTECIPVRAALEAVTKHAAFQYFAEGRKGMLKPGQLANLVVLDGNPLAIHPDSVRSIRVLATIREDACLWHAAR